MNKRIKDFVENWNSKYPDYLLVINYLEDADTYGAVIYLKEDITKPIFVTPCCWKEHELYGTLDLAKILSK